MSLWLIRKGFPPKQSREGCKTARLVAQESLSQSVKEYARKKI